MKIVFFGASKFSEELLSTLYDNGFKIDALFTIEQDFTVRKGEKVKNYNHANLIPLAEANNTPHYIVDSEDNKISSYMDVLEEIQPDVILVLGWYYMIPKSVRNLPKYGCCGIHASLLPKYAGWAPLVWAMIHGEEEAGVTFFQMDESVDGGDIIMQKSFPIEYEDTIKEVYAKATDASKQILLETLPVFDQLEFQKQDKSLIEIHDKRSPEDGLIDMNMTAKQMYDFVRAQSDPYPGAFIKTSDGKRLIIEKARIADDNC